MSDFDPKLTIFSTNEYLSSKLKSSFEENYLKVSVYRKPVDKELYDSSYLIIDLLGDSEKAVEYLPLVQKFEGKVVVLYPLTVEASKKYIAQENLNKLMKSNQSLGVLLVPEILSAAVPFNQDYLTHQIIQNSLLSERIKVNEKPFLNCVSLDSLVNLIVKETFSFGVAGKRAAVIGRRISQKSFAETVLASSVEDVVVVNGENPKTDLDYDLSLSVNFAFKKAVAEVVASIKPNLDKKVTQALVPELKNNINNKRKINYKKIGKPFLFIAVSLFFVVLVPLILLMISITLFYISVKAVSSNQEVALKTLSSSKQIASLVKDYNLGVTFYYQSGLLVEKTSGLLISVFDTSITASEFGSKIMGNEPFDPLVYTDKLSAQLERIYIDVSFVQSDIEEMSGWLGNLVRREIIERGFELSEYKSKIYEVKNLVSRLSHILGEEEKKKYLILFQNNMELRPTGGFIGSFAIASFEKGRMIDLSVSDVYSADGQLKGFVTPPEPIKTHLNEPAWYMRDANWDPDFEISASRIEWFLDKSINETVDGVIGIDLYLIQDLLSLVGPVTLTDFNRVVDSNNLYSVTQFEVEDEFFPGSIKKKSFMTSLSRSLIEEIKALNKDKYISLSKILYKNTEGRHIQVYLHDKYAQEAVVNLGYAGKVNMEIDCGFRCLNNKYMLVDANLGVNKANQYITRSQSFTQTVNNDEIINELVIEYKNIASVGTGAEGLYKSYTRLIVPKDSEILGARVYEFDGSYQTLNYDSHLSENRTDVGVLVEVSNNSTKTYQMSWKVKSDKLKDGGQLNLFVYKQAGTKNDRLDIRTISHNLSLTGTLKSVYNTDLLTNHSQKFFFK